MKILISTLFLIFFFSKVIGQNNDILMNVQLDTISSIDWRSFEVKQIKPFEDILKTHDLLILSESNHGDGASIDATTMILKGLIDAGAINTVYLESNWVNVEKIMEVLLSYGKDSIRSVIRYMTTSDLLYWVDNGFWSYLANKIIDRKIKLFGVDISAPSEKIVDEMLKSALELEQSKHLKVINPKLYNNAILYLTNINYYDSQTFLQKDTYNSIKPFFDTIINVYNQNGNLNKALHWKAIDNFFFWMHKRSRVIENNKVVNVIDNQLQRSQFYSSRDSMMANIFFKYYFAQNNQKAVATMSAYHSIHNSNEIEGITECCKENNVNILGEKIEKKLGDKIYNICFLKASGVIAINDYLRNTRQLKVIKPIEGSLEFYLNKRQIRFAFIDLENSELKGQGFYMNAVFHKYLKSNWSRNFSGVFFIKEMYPLIFKNSDSIKLD